MLRLGIIDFMSHKIDFMYERSILAAADPSKNFFLSRLGFYINVVRLSPPSHFHQASTEGGHPLSENNAG